MNEPGPRQLGYVGLDLRRRNESGRPTGFQHTVDEDGAWVPSIWRLEIGNSLQLSVRNGRIDKDFLDESLADLALLNIRIDPETDRFAWTDTLDLAQRFDLTCYDACYLELAQRLQMPLASLDRRLRLAAERLGVPILGA